MAHLIDVKTDSYTTDNLFIEIVSNNNKCRFNPSSTVKITDKMEERLDGCIFKTKADYWFYYFLNQDELYIFKPEDMIQHLKENSYPVARHTTHSTFGNDGLYESIGVLVNKYTVQDIVSVVSPVNNI